MSGEAERNYYKKQADSIKRSGDRLKATERSRDSGDRLRKTDATDAMTRKLKESSPAEKEAFYKKQKESVERSKNKLGANAEKEAYNRNLRKSIDESHQQFEDFRKEHKLGEYADKKRFKVPDPSWFEDK